MGAYCPVCGLYKPCVQVLTADGTPPRKGEDGVITVLGCGHTFGKDEFQEHQKNVAGLMGDYNKAVRGLKESRDEKIRGSWENMKAKAAGARVK